MTSSQPPILKPRPDGFFSLQSPYGESEIWRTGSHLRSITDAEGGLVLDIKTGRFHSLNTTGAVVWETLRQNPNGVGSARIIEAITAAFGPHPRIGSDLDKLLKTFEQKRLVQRHSGDRRDSKQNSPSSGEVPRRPVSDEDATVVRTMLGDLSAPAEFTKGKGGGLRTGAAWLCFLAVYLLIAIGGFPRLHQTLRWLAARRRGGAPSKEKILNLCVAVNKAATYYLRQSWCLHRAAVAFILLRLAGMPAELVIGCQRVPFYSHAWVEIHGVVINDDPGVKALYPELDRF
jgi:Transglutaminase-like superfamily/Coenzyme PQQ synthesis protein D (PqqD)